MCLFLLRYQCFCGNAPYGKQGTSSNCNMKCSGNPLEICGGANSKSIYLAKRK